MRISITDRCSLHCRYCMPGTRSFLPEEELLTADEIVQIASAAVTLGITRFKITGGEPLMRGDCAQIISRIRRTPGCEQVTLTTNGLLLEKKLPELLAAGLAAVNVSLDSTDPERYRLLTGYDGLSTVLAGIRASKAAGLPVKVNAVLGEDSPEGEINGLIALTREGIDVRFIELMPIGSGRLLAGVSNRDLLARLVSQYPGLSPAEETRGNGPAVYYQLPGISGRIGLISAIHGPFCDECNRVRVTADGKVKACLCYEETVDLKALLRENEEEPGRTDALSAALSGAIAGKPKQHAFLEEGGVTEKRGMSQIGG